MVHPCEDPLWGDLLQTKMWQREKGTSLCWFCDLFYWKRKCKSKSLKVLGTGSNKDMPPLIFRVEGFVDFKLFCLEKNCFIMRKRFLEGWVRPILRAFICVQGRWFFLLWDSKCSWWMFMEVCVWGCEINLSWYLPVLWKRQNMCVKHYNAKTCI